MRYIMHFMHIRVYLKTANNNKKQQQEQLLANGNFVVWQMVEIQQISKVKWNESETNPRRLLLKNHR